MKYNLSSVQPGCRWPSAIRRLYESSFPVDERRCFNDVVRLAETEPAFHADIYSTEGHDGVVGFVFYWHFAPFLYVEHFAVCENLRGQGHGRAVFRDFLTRSDRPVILEVERPEDETSRRRIRFYERLGLTRSDVPYMQPPYGPDRQPVPLALMSCGNFDLGMRFDEVRDLLYVKVYGVHPVAVVGNDLSGGERVFVT
jgi:ribosomal protein S18 acetylase RimI-like enzyme